MVVGRQKEVAHQALERVDHQKEAGLLEEDRPRKLDRPQQNHKILVELQKVDLPKEEDLQVVLNADLLSDLAGYLRPDCFKLLSNT